MDPEAFLLLAKPHHVDAYLDYLEKGQVRATTTGDPDGILDVEARVGGGGAKKTSATFIDGELTRVGCSCRRATLRTPCPHALALVAYALDEGLLDEGGAYSEDSDLIVQHALSAGRYGLAAWLASYADSDPKFRAAYLAMMDAEALLPGKILTLSTEIVTARDAVDEARRGDINPAGRERHVIATEIMLEKVATLVPLLVDELASERTSPQAPGPVSHVMMFAIAFESLSHVSPALLPNLPKLAEMAFGVTELLGHEFSQAEPADQQAVSDYLISSHSAYAKDVRDGHRGYMLIHPGQFLVIASNRDLSEEEFAYIDDELARYIDEARAKGLPELESLALGRATYLMFHNRFDEMLAAMSDLGDPVALMESFEEFMVDELGGGGV